MVAWLRLSRPPRRLPQRGSRRLEGTRMSDAVTSSAEPLWLNDAERSLPKASLRRVALLSLLTIAVGLGGVLTWAAIAQIDSAAPATGIVVASGKRKTVTV